MASKNKAWENRIHTSRRRMPNRDIKNTFLIYCEGINTEHFLPDEYPHEQTAEKPFTFIIATRLLYSKGIGTLADAASSEATARANEIKSLLAAKGSVDASSDVLSSPVVQNLREQQSTAARKISELSATYLPNHPKMMAAQNDLTNINRQIRAEALKVVEGLNEQAKIAKSREERS